MALRILIYTESSRPRPFLIYTESTRPRPFAFCLLPFAFCLLILFPSSSTTQAPPSSAPTCFPARPIAIDHWRGEYFNNPNLAGAPILVRDDNIGNLDFDWGLGSPSRECGVKEDDFSVRWTRTIPFGSGAYRFTIISDDGVRLLIDGQEKFRNWTDHPLTTNTFETPLTAGNHKITIEYYERLGSAIVKLKWEAHPCVDNIPPDHWRGEYFNNESLSGQPAMVRNDGDQTIFFDWRDESPNAGCLPNPSNYTVRWSRKVAFGNGYHRFHVMSNAGARVFVNGKLQLDEWRRQGELNSHFDLLLDAGNHLIVFEYRRGSGRARVSLNWELLPCFAEIPQEHWRGEYFNNDALTGSAVTVRDDGDEGINYKWGENSPAPACGVRTHGFSARWTRSRIFAGGVYRFLLSGNGGVKFVIDGQPKFDQWRATPFKSSVEVELPPGRHQLSIEYADLGGKASVSLNWIDPPCVAASVPTGHWRGEYFENLGLSGRPSVVRDEGSQMIDFERGLATPQTDCADFSDNFSARWSRTAAFEATTYRFKVTADDGVRLFIDGNKIIDQWHDQAETVLTADVEIPAGKHRVVLEYYNHFGSSIAKLSWAPAPCAAIVPIENWRGEYFNNTNLSGKPIMTRDDGGTIDLDWGLKSPESNCGINPDNFSARWTRTTAFENGLYRFHFTGDDGVRVYIDRQLKFDCWVDQMASHSFDVMVTAGNHQITVEYFEHWGSAAIKLSWERHPCFANVPPDHWRGEYFNNLNLSGQPVMIRDDGEGALDFDWGAQSPSASCGINADDFSVRWSRKVVLDKGWYRFTVTADDGVRLFVNGRKVVDEWRNQQPATFTADVLLPAGSNRIMVEYYDHTGGATVKAKWEMTRSGIAR